MTITAVEDAATAPLQTRDTGMSAAQLATMLAIVQAQAAVRRRLTLTAINAVLRPLSAFDDWYDANKITELVNTIARILIPTQRQMARVTDAYVARTLTQLTGRTVRPVGAVDVTRLRRRLPEDVLADLAAGRRQVPTIEIGDTFDGPSPAIDDALDALIGPDNDQPGFVSHQDAYGRLADQYRWRIISGGDSPDMAREKILIRGEQMARTDIALAGRAQEITTMRRRGVGTYRRVLHPELSETGLSCGLCIVAADRIYTTDQLREIHDRCNCEVLPIIGKKDPGIALNRSDLNALYAAAGGTTAGRALKRVRVAVTEHGELGPILVRGGTRLRDAADFARTQVPSPAVRAAAQLESMQESLERLRERAAAGEDVDAPLRFHTAKIAELRRKLGR